jgi:4-carboxymuconolactone decarboxylase
MTSPGGRLVRDRERRAGTGSGYCSGYDPAAHRFLGDAGMVELVSLCGYYTLISYLLNAFTVPLPPGTTPMWDGS